MNDLKIGIWGPTQSGKTTYLMALGIAALEWPEDCGKWTIVGQDAESELFMIGEENTLQYGEFPSPGYALNAYRWAFTGRPSLRPARSPARLRLTRPVQFTLDVLDAPGKIYDPNGFYGFDEEDQRRLLDHFLDCDGFVYLHDPVEQDQADGQPSAAAQLKAVQLLCSRLARAAHEAGQDVPLPQHLAVCVTKFDDPRAFAPALERNLIEQATRHSEPRCLDTRRYFETVAGRLLPAVFRNHFDPMRIEFFATSAVGFRRNTDDTVDLKDYANVRVVDGYPKVIGDVRPINVLEPLVWLEQRIRNLRGVRR